MAHPQRRAAWRSARTRGRRRARRDEPGTRCTTSPRRRVMFPRSTHICRDSRSPGDDESPPGGASPRGEYTLARLTTAANPPLGPGTAKSPAILPFIIVAAVFVLSRLWVLQWAEIRQSTVGLFTQTGYEYRYASAHNESVYAVHGRGIRDGLWGGANRGGGPPGDPSRLRLKYPPLATWAMILPTYFPPPIGPEWELTP